MAKIRVHEIAKELGIPSKEMVDILQNMNLDVKNHMSTVEESQANWIRKQLGTKEAGQKQVKRINKVEPGTQTRDPAPANVDPRPQSAPRKDTPPVKQQPNQQTNRPQTSSPDSREHRQPSVRQPDNRAPRPQDNRAPRPQDNRAPRPQDNRAPRPQDNRAPRPQDNPASRPQDNRAPRPQDNRAPRPQDNRAPRPQDNRAPRPQDNHPATPAAPQGSQPIRRDDTRPRPQSQDKRKPPSPRPGEKPAAPGEKRPQRAPESPKPSAGRTAPPKPRSEGKPGDKNKPVKKGAGPPTRGFGRPYKKSKHKRKKEDAVQVLPELITIGETITVRDLADKLNRGSAEIVKRLMDLGTMASINQVIDYETAEIVASLYEVKVEREVSEEARLLEEIVDDEASLVFRPPVVTVMGHVDHGKTSLLDRIRQADVVSGEAGGITQHIGAYQVKVNDNRITFIDTPGHEAFTAMRARGANLTDIVVLVVAADDGVMPQTVEAINHIRAAQVPFVVAVNKIDKPEANPDRVMQQLTEYGIVPEEWGGDTIFVPVSAKQGLNIDTLLEMILLVAEMQEIKANPDRPAEGVVVEGELDRGKGAVATVLVLKGTLKIGDVVVCGNKICRVRAMTDHRGRRVDKALPSMPVEITGWSEVPEAGGKVVVCDEKVAKEIVSLRNSEKKLEEQRQSSRVSLDDFFKQMQDAEVKELNLIIKGDVQGSIEALSQSLLRLSTEEVKVNVIHSAVGAITETDVMLASASRAIIIGFNVRPDMNAKRSAEVEDIDVRLYRVIYEAIDDVKKAMVGLLDPEYQEKYLGRAEARALFKVPDIGMVAGCYVLDGKIQRNSNVRVLRDGVIIYDGKLASLKRFKDDVKEVMENYECGMGIKDFNDLKEGDIIEAYVMEEIPRHL